ncbi:MAG: hypothetical protein IJJ29_01270, partial [Solobacterium sp.]|nr:hypothetical protein [Solobacterium sp.]
AYKSTFTHFDSTGYLKPPSIAVRKIYRKEMVYPFEHQSDESIGIYQEVTGCGNISCFLYARISVKQKKYSA